jgi:capsular polysaccharide biosynthesis protein
VAARTLLSIRRHWLLIVSLVALAVVLAFIGIPVMPRKYSAIASIFPSLYSQEQGKIVALATVDATSIVNGEARLLLSDAILQAVVSRLGPQQPPEAGQGSGWFRTTFFPGIRTDSPLDREMAMLRSKVEVAKDPRSYLISISFTASCADEAARVASSTIAVEYLRDKWVQRKRDAVIAAEAELTRQLAVNGDKHPKVLLAVEALDVAHADLKAIMAPDEGGQDSVRTDEGVKLALPNRTPTSPRGFVILGLSCTLGLLAGVGLAIWRYRRGLEPFDLAFGRQFIAGVLGRRVGVGIFLEKPLFQRIGMHLTSLIQRPRLRQIIVDHRSLLQRRRGFTQQIAWSVEGEQPDRSATNDAVATRSPPARKRRRRERRFKW